MGRVLDDNNVEERIKQYGPNYLVSRSCKVKSLRR